MWFRKFSMCESKHSTHAHTHEPGSTCEQRAKPHARRCRGTLEHAIVWQNTPCTVCQTAMACCLGVVEQWCQMVKYNTSFLQKCVILHSCVHGRRKDFPGGSSWFFEKFCRRAKKWRNMFFYHLKWRKQHFLLKCSNSCPLPTMPVTNLGHQGRWRVFWEGPKFFKLCPIVLNYVQHIFPRRAKIVSRAKAPLVTGLLPTPMLVCRKKFVPHHLKIGVISSVLTPF